MKKILLLFLMIFILLSSFVLAGELKQDLSNIVSEAGDEKVSVIILFEEKPTPAEISTIKSDGASIKYQYGIIDAVAAQVPANAADKIAKRAFVKLVEPDYDVKLVLDKSIPKIQADKVWEENITGKNIDIAIIDTGIHNEHPSLTIEKEIDYTGEGTDDLHGHGTHVAGIVASTDSTYRGVAYDSDLFNVKVLNKQGSGSGSDVIKGIEWAAENGAEIISMSFGAEIDPCDGTDAISQAVDKAVNKGVVAVVAAGNSGPDAGTITSPGCSKKGIAIGAVDDNDNVPSWSSRGPTDDGRVKPDLVAPGVSIASTWKDNSFKSLSGTSMSTPHVSGVAALLLETDSTIGPSDIKEILKTTALDLGLDENTQGAGRVDAYESYLFLINTTEEPSNETEEPEEEKESPPKWDRELERGRKPKGIGYGLSRAWEKINLAFTFNEQKKAELHLKFAERRLSESLEILDEDKEKAKELLEEYEENLEKSNEISKIAQQVGENVTKVTELVAIATSIHRDVLEEVLEKVPEQAKPSIQKAINFSNKENKKALNNLEEIQPEKAAEINFRIAEKTLNQAREKAEKGEIEDVDNLIKEYEERINKSFESAEKARGLGNNTTSVEKIISESTSTHLEILSEVNEKVPEQAKESIEKAIASSTNGKEKTDEILKEKDDSNKISEDGSDSDEIKEETEIPVEVPETSGSESETDNGANQNKETSDEGSKASADNKPSIIGDAINSGDNEPFFIKFFKQLFKNK